MSKIFSIVVMSFLFFIPSTFAFDVCLDGFGEAGVDGTYVDSGNNGKPYYLKSPYEIFWWNSDGNWLISYGSALDSNDPAQYYATQNVATPDLVSSWTVYLGYTPAGTITECSEPEPDPIVDSGLFGSSTATSTPTLGDVTVGLSIIIVLLFLFVIAYVWNIISEKRKKPWHS